MSVINRIENKRQLYIQINGLIKELKTQDERVQSEISRMEYLLMTNGNRIKELIALIEQMGEEDLRLEYKNDPS